MLTLESKAYQEDDFKGIDLEEFVFPENVIRWRHTVNDEGEVVPETNARIVKWEDGSSHLFIGDEAFLVNAAPQLKPISCPHYIMCSPDDTELTGTFTESDQKRQLHQVYSAVHGKIDIKAPLHNKSRTEFAEAIKLYRENHERNRQASEKFAPSAAQIAQQQRHAQMSELRQREREQKEREEKRKSRFTKSFLQEGFSDDEETGGRLKTMKQESDEEEEDAARLRLAMAAQDEDDSDEDLLTLEPLNQVALEEEEEEEAEEEEEEEVLEEIVKEKKKKHKKEKKNKKEKKHKKKKKRKHEEEEKVSEQEEAEGDEEVLKEESSDDEVAIGQNSKRNVKRRRIGASDSESDE